MGHKRDNFTEEVKTKLSIRAGLRCSHPSCSKLTKGPSDENDGKVLNLGQAAHITAASPRGPRYDSSLTQQERRSISNGIWLCAEHAKLIDSEQSKHTADLLREWKQLAEHNASMRLLQGREKPSFVMTLRREYVELSSIVDKSLLIEPIDDGLLYQGKCLLERPTSLLRMCGSPFLVAYLFVAGAVIIFLAAMLKVPLFESFISAAYFVTVIILGRYMIVDMRRELTQIISSRP